MREIQDGFGNIIYKDRQYKKYIWFNKNEIIPTRTVFEGFLKNNIYIDGFVSDSHECIGVYLLNKQIYSINEIDMENSFVFSIQKLKKYPMIQNVVVNADEMCGNNAGNVFLDEKECFGIQNIGWMREIVKDKNLFIYGISDRTKKLAEIYELLDFHVEGYIDDESYEKEKEENGEIKILAIEDIIYEEDYFILINREYYRDMAGRLTDLGLQMFDDMAIDNPFGTWYLGTGNQVLDINLGHSFLGKQGMYGFEMSGENNAHDMKIMILGGSTTDGALFPFRSWPQFLLDRAGGKNVTIFNGGVVGYTSTQELIKLLRDILFMEPDMVIVYDGFNDMTAPSVPGPFAFKELQKAMDYVDQHKDKLWLDLFAEGAMPYTGVEPKADKYEIWLNNIKKMRAICEVQGIQFFAFLQPVLYSKASRTKEEEGLLWSTWRINNCYEWANEFRSRIKSNEESCGYIHDLSHIFDKEDGIYMDDCHVYERGNEMIAASIYEVIKDSLI